MMVRKACDELLYYACDGSKIKKSGNDEQWLPYHHYVLGLQCVSAFSSTDRFMDDLTEVDDYTTSNTSRLSANASFSSFALYKTARISPLVLTYYRLCIGNGNYTVSLHFSEIIITDSSFYSFGKRVFDIHVQVLRNPSVNVSY
ncbi:unnamed protein product [Arabidopsis halleri]